MNVCVWHEQAGGEKKKAKKERMLESGLRGSSNVCVGDVGAKRRQKREEMSAMCHESADLLASTFVE